MVHKYVILKSVEIRISWAGSWENRKGPLFRMSNKSNSVIQFIHNSVRSLASGMIKRANQGQLLHPSHAENVQVKMSKGQQVVVQVFVLISVFWTLSLKYVRTTKPSPSNSKMLQGIVRKREDAREKHGLQCPRVSF